MAPLLGRCDARMVDPQGRRALAASQHLDNVPCLRDTWAQSNPQVTTEALSPPEELPGRKDGRFLPGSQEVRGSNPLGPTEKPGSEGLARRKLRTCGRRGWDRIETVGRW